jgi:hypothetical protein
MNRKSFLKITGIFAGIVTFPSLAYKSEIPMNKINFRHVVYFWLNNPDNQSERKQFLHNLKDFISRMDNILEAHIGIPAGTKRDVVDNSYQFCLDLGFESKEEHDIYQAHPLHKEFIDKSARFWTRVLVYDSIPV